MMKVYYMVSMPEIRSFLRTFVVCPTKSLLVITTRIAFALLVKYGTAAANEPYHYVCRRLCRGLFAPCSGRYLAVGVATNRTLEECKTYFLVGGKTRILSQEQLQPASEL